MLLINYWYLKKTNYGSITNRLFVAGCATFLRAGSYGGGFSSGFGEAMLRRRFRGREAPGKGPADLALFPLGAGTFRHADRVQPICLAVKIAATAEYFFLGVNGLGAYSVI